MIFGDRPGLANCILWWFARANVRAICMPKSAAETREAHGDDVLKLSDALANRDFRLNIFRRLGLQGNIPLGTMVDEYTFEHLKYYVCG